MLDADVVRDIAAEAVDDRAGSVLYADRLPVGPGTVPVAGRDVELGSSAIVAFRDDAPGANWMHPCVYALVDVSTRAVLAILPAESPPTFGMLPEHWIVARDPDGRADLVRPTDPQGKEEP